eukprot:6180142-Pleurochrysis_carterae.AAC.1
MGLDILLIQTELTWLLGMTKTGQLLPTAYLAVIRIHWRHVYAAMVRQRIDGDAFSSTRVTTDIARIFLSRIIAYQHELRLRFFKQRYSHDENYKLPKAAAIQVEHVGNLRLTDGTLFVKSGSRSTSKVPCHGVSCDTACSAAAMAAERVVAQLTCEAPYPANQ